MTGAKQNGGRDLLAEAFRADPLMRWKIEAWLKAQERKSFQERPPKIFESFESHWRKVREERIENNFREALLAVARFGKGQPEALPENSAPAASAPQQATAAPAGSQQNRRQEPRRNENNILTTLIITAQGGAPVRESAMLENVSRGGACVLSKSAVERGRYLQLITPERKKSLIATVRDTRPGPDNKMHLHLQFINQQWPFELNLT